MRCKTFLIAAMAVSFLAVANVQATPMVVNPSFETNSANPAANVTVYTAPFQTGFTVADWTFGPSDTTIGDVIGLTGPAGLGGYTGFDGNVAAVFEGTGFIEQSVLGFAATSYTVSFLAQGREDAGLGPQPIEVFLGGTQLTFSALPNTTPGTLLTPLTTGGLVTYTSDPVAVSAGANTLRFQGTEAFGGGVDLTTVIDLVSVTAIPEPSSVMLMLVASLGMVGFARRRRA